MHFCTQGAAILHVDNVRAAEGKVKHAIDTLAEGLSPLSNGEPDSGVRQDLYHLFNRMLEALCKAIGLKAKKGITVQVESMQTQVYHSNLHLPLACVL